MGFLLYSKGNGVYLTRIKCEEDSARIAVGDIYLYNGYLLMVQNCSSKTAVERDMLSSMLLWVRLRGIREHIWQTEMLTKMFSLIGKPLRMDHHPTNGEIQQYTRVCIIIDMHKSISEMVKVKVMDGDEIRMEIIQVYIEILLARCLCSKSSDDGCHTTPYGKSYGYCPYTHNCFNH